MSTSVSCNSSVLTNGGNNTLICNAARSVFFPSHAHVAAAASWPGRARQSALHSLTLFTRARTLSPPSGFNFSTNAAIGTSAGGTASGNIDPLYGQYYTGVITTANAGYTTPQTLLTSFGTTPAVLANGTNLSGLAVIPQPGFGGQSVNVSLGPQTAANQNGLNVVWGVHATPYTNGQTAASAATSAGLLISWYMGDNTLNASLPTGATPPTGQTSAAGFAPLGVTFTASIQLQATPPSGSAVNSTVTLSVGANMTCLQYWRNYTQAVGWTYLSPYVCHAIVTGLPAGGYLNYWITANVTVGSAMPTTYITSATQMSGGYFTANLMPAPSGMGVAASSIYPFQWVLMADVGQTYNSSLTAQYIQRFDTIVGNNGVDAILNVADLTYADNYGAYMRARVRILRHVVLTLASHCAHRRFPVPQAPPPTTCPTPALAAPTSSGGTAGAPCGRVSWATTWSFTPPATTSWTRRRATSSPTRTGPAPTATRHSTPWASPTSRSSPGRPATPTALCRPPRWVTSGPPPGSPRTWAPCTWWCSTTTCPSTPAPASTTSLWLTWRQ